MKFLFGAVIASFFFICVQIEQSHAQSSCEDVFRPMSPAEAYRLEVYDRVSRRILDLENHHKEILGAYRISRHQRGEDSKVNAVEMRMSLRSAGLKKVAELASVDPTYTALGSSEGLNPIWKSITSTEKLQDAYRAILLQVRSRFSTRMPANLFEQIARLGQEKHEGFLKVLKQFRAGQDTSASFMFLAVELNLPKDMSAEQMIRAFDSASIGEPYEVALLRIYDRGTLQDPKSTISLLSVLVRTIVLEEASRTEDGYYEYLGALRREKETTAGAGNPRLFVFF